MLTVSEIADILRVADFVVSALLIAVVAVAFAIEYLRRTLRRSFRTLDDRLQKMEDTDVEKSYKMEIEGQLNSALDRVETIHNDFRMWRGKWEKRFATAPEDYDLPPKVTEADQMLGEVEAATLDDQSHVPATGRIVRTSGR